jgi:hypothetical protein
LDARLELGPRRKGIACATPAFSEHALSRLCEVPHKRLRARFKIQHGTK